MMRRGAGNINGQKKARLGWVFFVLLGVAMIVVLFSIKTKARQAKAKVRYLEHVLVQEQAQLRMINAEIAHLKNPKRLQSLAEDHLNLQPTRADKVLTLEQAAQKFANPDIDGPGNNGGQ